MSKTERVTESSGNEDKICRESAEDYLRRVRSDLEISGLFSPEQGLKHLITTMSLERIQSSGAWGCPTVEQGKCLDKRLELYAMELTLKEDGTSRPTHGEDGKFPTKEIDDRLVNKTVQEFLGAIGEFRDWCGECINNGDCEKQL